jgi:predicted 3-demethylubiquinone-9 3-methyltransferase (glyoxalase superfamily)
MIRQKIRTFLWFNDQAEEAANFYVSLFKDSKIVSITHYGETGPGPVGSVMVVVFQLAGVEFIALNGGPVFKFNEATSLSVDCESQAEVDWFWEKLSEGGSTGQCAWLKDRFGLSWQIVPTALPRLLNDPDPMKSQRVMQAMMQMTKINIQQLQDACDGR